MVRTGMPSDALEPAELRAARTSPFNAIDWRFGVILGVSVATHFAFNGTGANVTALMSFAKPHGAVLCSEVAHVVNDESTAAIRALNAKIFGDTRVSLSFLPFADGLTLVRKN